jgi:hypothetical protein
MPARLVMSAEPSPLAPQIQWRRYSSHGSRRMFALGSHIAARIKTRPLEDFRTGVRESCRGQTWPIRCISPPTQGPPSSSSAKSSARQARTAVALRVPFFSLGGTGFGGSPRIGSPFYSIRSSVAILWPRKARIRIEAVPVRPGGSSGLPGRGRFERHGEIPALRPELRGKPVFRDVKNLGARG